MKCAMLDEWDDILRNIGTERSDVYLTEGYHALYRTDTAAPVCFVAQGALGVYLLPGILHSPSGNDTGLFFESAYGYGGPVSSSSDSAFVLAASAAVCHSFREVGVSRARLRFHPVLQNHSLVGPEWSVAYSRDTAGINLAGSPSDILRAMHPKHRNGVSRARRSGLEFVWDEESASLEEFKALYNSTMDRLQAEDAYYYGNAYYEILRADLGDRVALGLVLHEDSVVSAALFFRQGRYSNYHLSGSIADGPPGAGQLLLYGAAVALQQAGAEILHLGGGTSPSPDDTLLKFKQRFGSLRFQYHVGTWSALAGTAVVGGADPK